MIRLEKSAPYPPEARLEPYPSGTIFCRGKFIYIILDYFPQTINIEARYYCYDVAYKEHFYSSYPWVHFHSFYNKILFVPEKK